MIDLASFLPFEYVQSSPMRNFSWL
jgi:hypothetical protein